jgi:hypothetical protein
LIAKAVPVQAGGGGHDPDGEDKHERAVGPDRSGGRRGALRRTSREVACPSRADRPVTPVLRGAGQLLSCAGQPGRGDLMVTVAVHVPSTSPTSGGAPIERLRAGSSC